MVPYATKQVLPMAKTMFFLRVSTWSASKESYITEYKDSKLYDLESKDDRKLLAQTALRLLIEGSEVKLYQKLDRSSLNTSISDADLF